MGDVATDSHSEASGEGFEDALYLVMLVLPFGLDVEVHGSTVGQALEEVQEHLCGHLAHLLAMKLGIPYEPGTAPEVECHMAQAVVHWQAIAIALYAALVAKSLAQALAKSKGNVLDGVVLIDMQVSIAADVKVCHAMLGNLLQHVVEESKPRLYVAFAIAVQTDTHLNVCLLRGAAYN